MRKKLLLTYRVIIDTNNIYAKLKIIEEIKKKEKKWRKNKEMLKNCDKV